MLAASALIGNGAIAGLERRFDGLSLRQQGLEAGYRFALMHLRNDPERVAMLHSERAVTLGLRHRLQQLLPISSGSSAGANW